MENNQKQNELSIEIKPEIASGNYSNIAIITHSTSEFVIDFARLLPGVPKAQVATRVIMTPENTKRLFMALKANLEKFESQNGEIRTDKQGGINIPMGFGSNTPKA